MGVPPFAADQAWSPNHPSAHNPFCFPFNMSEQPVAAFNGGFSDDGLPIGLQIVGRRGDDSGVPRVVAAYVRAAESANAGPGFREF